MCALAPTEWAVLGVGTIADPATVQTAAKLAAVAAAVTSGLWFSTDARLLLHRPTALLVAIPAAAVATAWLADQPVAAATGALLFLGQVVAVGLATTTRGGSAAARSIIVGLSLALVLSLGAAIGGQDTTDSLGDGDPGLWGVGRFRGVFIDANALGQATVVVVILCCWVFASRVRFDRSSTAALFFVMTAGLVGLGASQSRTAFLALLAAIIVVVIRSEKTRWAALLAAPIAVLAVATASRSDLVTEGVSRDAETTELSTLTGRTEIWTYTLNHLADVPFLGNGMNNGQSFFRAAALDGTLPFEAGHAHNATLDLYLVLGPLGPALLIGFLGAYVCVCRTHRDVWRDSIVIAAFVGTLTESVFVGSSNPYLLGVTVAASSLALRPKAERIAASDLRAPTTRGSRSTSSRSIATQRR